MLKLIFLIAGYAFLIIAGPYNKTYDRVILVQSCNTGAGTENSIIQEGPYLKCKIDGKD